MLSQCDHQTSTLEGAAVSPCWQAMNIRVTLKMFENVCHDGGGNRQAIL